MDDILNDVGKGIFRIFGFILAELFFGTVCYWIGFLICKVVTLGGYPMDNSFVFLELNDVYSEGFWCSVAGFITIIFSVLYFTGQFF